MDIKLVFNNKVYADVTIDDQLINICGEPDVFIARELIPYITVCLNRLSEERDQTHEA